MSNHSDQILSTCWTSWRKSVSDKKQPAIVHKRQPHKKNYNNHNGIVDQSESYYCYTSFVFLLANKVIRCRASNDVITTSMCFLYTSMHCDDASIHESEVFRSDPDQRISVIYPYWMMRGMMRCCQIRLRWPELCGRSVLSTRSTFYTDKLCKNKEWIKNLRDYDKTSKQ